MTRTIYRYYKETNAFATQAFPILLMFLVEYFILAAVNFV
jgi:hypothetical protein